VERAFGDLRHLMRPSLAMNGEGRMNAKTDSATSFALVMYCPLGKRHSRDQVV
jgi:hypothetical protein